MKWPESFVLARLLAQARSAWPGIDVADERFAALVAEKSPDGVTPEEQLELPAADLYLACACAGGDAGAITAFERHHFSAIDAVLARVRDPTLAADDVRQALREKLFVASPGAPPKIAEYAGKGTLAAWFRVTTMRTVLNIVRRSKDVPVPLDHEVLLALATQGATAPTAEDAELAQLKARYRAEFKLAFSDAVEALSARERNLLRYAFVDGLAADEIASIYGVHRTTVNRWLADLGRSLTSGVRTAMLERLRIDRRELESILRLIRSRLDITIERYAGR
jgi:RNA polymerase sigma-70 factor (ECF subfamily)